MSVSNHTAAKRVTPKPINMKYLFVITMTILFTTALSAQTFDEHMKLGKSAEKDGDYEVAIKEYSRAIALNPRHSFTRFRRSICYEQRNDYNAAYADIDTAIQIDPWYEYYYSVRGRYLYELDKYEAALKDLNRALEADSTIDLGFYYRYLVYKKLGDLPQSFRDITKAVRLDPQFSRYIYNRGDLFKEFGERDSAIASYKQAFHLAKNDDYLLSYLITCDMRDLNELDTALSWYNWSLEKFGRHIGNLGGRGETYFRMGRFQESLQDFTELIIDHQKRRSPRLAYLCYSRGLVYDSLGDRNKALIDFNESLAWDSTYSPSYACRGSLRLRAGETDKAFRDLNKAIFHQPNLGVAYYFRGLIYLNDYKDAESACADFMAARRFKYKPAIAMLRKNCATGYK